MDSAIVTNGTVLLADGRSVPRDIRIRDGVIAEIGTNLRVSDGDRIVDAAGRHVLPGIVDIHGDAFERQIMPRPGVHFPLDVALLDTDSQMIANGITTAFHGITHSWEPGLRGRDNFLNILEALESVRGALRCDTRIHMRFETFNVDAADEAAEWVAAGRIGLLAFNDHAPEIHDECRRQVPIGKYAQRTGLSEDGFVALVERVHARAGEVPGVVERLAAVARAAGIPLLSHDDELPEVRSHYNDLGCTICEFPETEATARRARRLGNPVVMGAPNVVRGGSHNGAISAAAMIAAGLCTVLASDYYYPAPLLAAWKLHRDAGMALGDAWSLVSRAPALAAGLDDRGEIAEGRRGDLIVVEDAGVPGLAVPRVAATIVAGRTVWMG